MLRSLLRSIATAPAKSSSHSIPHHLTSSRTFATKKPSKGSNNKKPQQKSKSDPKSKSKQDEIAASSSLDDAAHDVISDEKNRRRLLDEDERDKSLDVGPNGRPLFTSASSLAELNRKDACSYIKFSRKKLEEVLAERLPVGMVKEFDESMREALLVRHSFLDLRDNFRRVADPPLQSSNSKGVSF